MYRKVTNLGDLIRVVKELNEVELTTSLLRVLNSNSYRVRKEGLIIMKKILNENGIQLSDELISGFIGDSSELVEALS